MEMRMADDRISRAGLLVDREFCRLKMTLNGGFVCQQQQQISSREGLLMKMN